MELRKLGKTGKDVSEIGFGGWGIGKTWWGPTEDSQSLQALEEAWNQGVNFFDTAYVYGDGHSEALMGQALKGKDAFIATKIPPKNMEWPADPKKPVSESFPPDWIVSCTERSLQKLNRDFVDLNQFHVWADEWLETDDWKEAIVRLKKEGKIKAFGVSINDHQPDTALNLVVSGLVDTVQVIFNIFDQSPMEKLFPLCREKNVGVIVRVPLDEGGLTGKLSIDSKFEGDDFRAHYFKGDNLRKTVERTENLKAFVGNGVKSLPELALKFILSEEAVSVVIPGMRSPDHVKMNVGVSGSLPLSPKTKAALKNHAWPRNFYKEWV